MATKKVKVYLLWYTDFVFCVFDSYEAANAYIQATPHPSLYGIEEFEVLGANKEVQS